MSFSSDKSLMSNQVPTFDDFPDIKDPQFRDILSLYFKRMADAVNTKEGALYQPQELATFQRYFTLNNPQKTRNVYRKVIEVPAVTAGAAATVIPHGITGIVACTHIYGACVTSLPDFRPMPYASVGGGNIDIRVDSTNLYVLVGAGSPNIVSGTVVIEYLKNL